MAEERTRTTDTGRGEAFSDGVLAIALTLLVLDLITDHESSRYTQDLVDQWPAYLAYVAAFLTIASIWLSHHDAFSRLERVDTVARVLNLLLLLLLLLLLGVALVPWPTALLSSALRDGTLADQRATIVVYVVVSLIVAAGWSAMSASVVRRPSLVGDPADVGWFRANARFSATAGGIAVLGGLIGWFAPVVALIVFLLVPGGFVVVTLRSARRR